MTTLSLPRIDQVDSAGSGSGFGSLKSEHGNLPLQHLGYHSRVVGLSVATTISQTFYNPFDEPIEATYVFPIEGEQAVVGCELWVEDRIVRAELKERGQARSDYRRALRQGYRAALLEENRPETFSMKVGNIPPGEAVQVRIRTVGRLQVVKVPDGGEWTLRLPLVVAPRYTSGFPIPYRSSFSGAYAGNRTAAGDGVAFDTDRVPDASAVTPPVWLPGFASPVHLRLSVDLHIGSLGMTTAWHERLRSSLHSIAVTEAGKNTCHIEIRPDERVNRDFILRGKIDTDRICGGLSIEQSRQPGETVNSSVDANVSNSATFALDLIPPPSDTSPPRDIVFLLDRSGSMSGWKMTAARRGISRLVDTLGPDDRFQVLAFDDRVDDPFAGRFQANHGFARATDANRYEATRWLAKIETRGGTEMGTAIARALEPFTGSANREGEPGATSHQRSSAIVLVTDGQITGEDDVLSILGRIPVANRPRIFCLGVDRAVNASVLQRLTKFSGGTFELVESEQRLDEIMVRFADEIGSPSITNVTIEAIDSHGMPNSTPLHSLAPEHQRDLYPMRPVSIYGRVVTDGSTHAGLSLRVRGRMTSGQPWEQIFTATDVRCETSDDEVLRHLWGRGRVRQLEDEYFSGSIVDEALRDEIVRCSLSAGVLSRFTAFVAVDESRRVAWTDPHRIAEPVEQPEGWLPASLPPDSLIAIPGRRSTPIAQVSADRSAGRFPLPENFGDIIIQRGIVSLDQYSDAESYAKQSNQNIAQALVRLQYASEEEVAEVTAQVFKLPYVDLRSVSIGAEVVELIPESVARENSVMPFRESGGAMIVLLSNPADLETIEKLRFILNRPIQTMVASEKSILASINHYYGQVEGESADSMLQEFTDTAIDFTETESDDMLLDDDDSFGLADDIVAGDLSIDSFFMSAAPVPPMFSARRWVARQSKPESPGEAPVVRLVNLLISEALQLRATHIILHPHSDRISIEYVIDGKAVPRESVPRRMLSAIVGRFKILSKLDIAIRARRQSGILEIACGSGTNLAQVRCRVHIGGTTDGETVMVDLSDADQGLDSSTNFDPAQQSQRQDLPPSVRDWWSKC